MAGVLAMDLGGSSLRAAIVDDSGAILAGATVSEDLPTAPGGRSELDPNVWWDGLVSACGRLAADHREAFERVQAVTICGVTRTQVLLDAGGKVLRPALLWNDTRAQPDLEAFSAVLAASGHEEAGAINAFHPAARLLWLRRHEPAVFEALRFVVDPKDFLNMRLTGTVASDWVSLARLAAASTKRDGRSLLEALGIPGDFLPGLGDPAGIVGPVAKGLPSPLDRIAGRPVVAGSNDTFSAVLGLGAMKPGTAYNISGTTEVFGVIGKREAKAEGLVSIRWGDGLWQLGGPGQNGADVLRWLLPLVGHDASSAWAIEAAMEDLLARPRHPQPMLFLPYLRGERMPFWNPDLRGAFAGIHRSHGAGDFLWSVLEGVAFLNGVVLERAEEALGEAVSEVRFGGGAARSGDWAAIKANVFERPVVVCAADEPGIVGAAILGLTAAGCFESLDQAQRKMVKILRVVEPDPDSRPYYRAMRTLFLEANAAINPVSEELARLPGRVAAPGRPVAS